MKNRIKLIIVLFTSLTFVMCTEKSSNSNQNNIEYKINKDSVTQKDKKYIKVCWPSYKVKEPVIDSTPFDQMTHLTICFAYPNEDGTLNTSQIDSIDKLVSKCHQNNVKAILNIGGEGLTSDHFPTVSIDSVLRRKFVSNLTKYAIEHNVDGVEIDWECWPTPEKVDTIISKSIVSLFSDLRSALPTNIVLSYDVYPSNWYGKHFPTKLIDYVDEIVIMVFSYTGPWSEIGHHSPAEKVEESYNYWIGRIGKENNDKVVIASPFFGYNFRNNHTEGNSNTCNFLQYRDIVRDYPEAYLNDTIRTDSSVIFHNGINTFKEKIDFIKNHDLKGISIWELSYDTIVEGKTLLKYIHEEMNR